MLTCNQCKDAACPDMGSGGPGCEDFTSEAIEEEPVEFEPTPEAYKELKKMYGTAIDEINRLETRLDGYQNAVAELVRWAQDERP